MGCIVDTKFYDRLLIATIGPMLVLGVLRGTYAIAQYRNGHDPCAQQAVKRKHLAMALFVTFIVYSSTSYTIFQTFVCDRAVDTEVAYLQADYRLECETNEHTALKVYAGLMVLVYPIGIPATFAWWLFSHPYDLKKVGRPGTAMDHLKIMEDLWGPYKPRRYFFEIVEYARRISLTGLTVFVYPGTTTQMAITATLTIVFYAISEILSPFVHAVDRWLHRVGSCGVYSGMFLARLLKVDASDENSESQKAFGRMLIAANVGLGLAVVIESALSINSMIRTPRAVERSFPVEITESEGVQVHERTTPPPQLLPM